MACRTLGTVLLFSCILAPAAGSAQSNPQVAFDLRSQPAGGEPRAAAAADFNDDGAPDFATANLTLTGGGSGVAVFYNRGDGTFSAATPIVTGAGAFGLATADFNRDGRVDLAVSNADANTVTVLLSSEAGLIPTFTWPTSASPRGIVAGDFTRDGQIDLAVAGYGCGCLDVGRGHGDGTVTTVTTIDLAPNAESLVTADFNRDGTLDLFVATAASKVLVLFGRDGGDFAKVWEASDINQRALDTGDFDGDGRPDVAAVSDRSVAVFYRVPSGQLFAQGQGGPAPGYRGVIVLDVNSDGWPDVAQAARNTGLVGVRIGSRRAGSSGFWAPVSFSTGAGARALAAADFDGDGRTDLISGNQYAETVTVMINRTPRFAPTTDVQ